MPTLRHEIQIQFWFFFREIFNVMNLKSEMSCQVTDNPRSMWINASCITSLQLLVSTLCFSAVETVNVKVRNSMYRMIGKQSNGQTFTRVLKPLKIQIVRWLSTCLYNYRNKKISLSPDNTDHQLAYQNHVLFYEGCVRLKNLQYCAPSDPQGVCWRQQPDNPATIADLQCYSLD